MEFSLVVVSAWKQKHGLPRTESASNAFEGLERSMQVQIYQCRALLAMQDHAGRVSEDETAVSWPLKKPRADIARSSELSLKTDGAKGAALIYRRRQSLGGSTVGEPRSQQARSRYHTGALPSLTAPTTSHVNEHHDDFYSISELDTGNEVLFVILSLFCGSEDHSHTTYNTETLLGGEILVASILQPHEKGWADSAASLAQIGIQVTT